MINLIVAIPCEAKPLIRHLKLQKQLAYRSYNLFRRDDIQLLVCGVGKLAAASGCAWLQGLSEQRPEQQTEAQTEQSTAGLSAAWLNIGVAGHGYQPIGTGLIAHRIGEASSDRRWYPGFINKPPCPSAALISVDQPETRYPDNALYDMEASGFYTSCSRFSSIELIHSFKVVSDNRFSGIGNINEQTVSELIHNQLDTIDMLIKQLRNDRQQLAPQQRPPEHLNTCLQHWHFSHYQQQQLRQLLLRRQTLMAEQKLWDTEFKQLRNAKLVLAFLQQQLDRQPVRFAP